MKASRTVMHALVATFTVEITLHTPDRSRHKAFVARPPTSTTGHVVLVVGSGKECRVHADCWNGIPDFLRGRGWVRIGATHSSSGNETLQSYLDGRADWYTASYVASVLVHAGIAEVDAGTPNKIMLMPGW